jgi:hypothetical protein
MFLKTGVYLKEKKAKKCNILEDTVNPERTVTNKITPLLTRWAG